VVSVAIEGLTDLKHYMSSVECDTELFLELNMIVVPALFLRFGVPASATTT
jgi:hypothetical protein